MNRTSTLRPLARAGLLAAGLVAATSVVAGTGGSGDVVEATSAIEVHAAPAVVGVQIDGAECVDFSGTRLLNRDGEDSSALALLSLPVGTYRLDLVSTDVTHVDTPDPAQTEEQWLLITGLGVQYGPTLDLADDDIKNVTSLEVVVDIDITEVRAQHVRLGSSINSIDPATACFTPIDTPTTTTVAPAVTTTTVAPATTTSTPTTTVVDETTTTTTVPAPTELAVTGPPDGWLVMLTALSLAMIGFGAAHEWAQRRRRRQQ